MCEKCKNPGCPGDVAKSLVATVKQFCKERNLELTPGIILTLMDKLLNVIGEAAIAIFIDEAVAQVCNDLGLNPNCSQEVLCNELLERRDKGTLPPHLEKAVAHAATLIRATRGLNFEDSNGAPGSELLN